MRYVCKLLLSEAGVKAKEECGTKQLCAGLEAGIKGGLRSVLEMAEKLGGMHFTDGEVDEEELTAAAEPELDSDGESDGDGNTGEMRVANKRRQLSPHE